MLRTSEELTLAQLQEVTLGDQGACVAVAASFAPSADFIYIIMP